MEKMLLPLLVYELNMDLFKFGHPLLDSIYEENQYMYQTVACLC